MNEITKDSLNEQYPSIFTDTFRGFEIPDGWLALLAATCKQIQVHIDATPGVPQLEALQVKSKFGLMRFYRQGGDAYCDGVISMSEAVSRTLCELCGNKGTQLKTRGWIIVRCTAHLNVDNF